MNLHYVVCILGLACALARGESSKAVTIYPIDQAAIVAGSRFDFKVEFPGVLDAGDFELKIGGKPAADMLRSQGTLIQENFSKPTAADSQILEGPFTASAYVARNCVLHAEADSLAVEVYVKKDKVAEVTWRVYRPKAEGRAAKNVILMIGDGLSQAHRTAARIMSKGIKEGKYAAQLAMDDMPHMGLVGTSGVDSIITDSANSASAYTTGHKTSNGALGVYKDRTIDYATGTLDEKNYPDETDDPAHESIATLARRFRGMSVGAVTDAEIQDATPAAMYAHIATRRHYYSIVDMLAKSNFEVIMGGGRASFSDTQFAAFAAQGCAVAETRTELLNVGTPKRLFGIFNQGNIDGAWDRKFLKNFTPPDRQDQPDLTEMAAAALKVLDTNPNGFVLMIEGARIDKFSHALDWERAVMDTIMFDHTVALVKEFAAKRNDTLVLVLGDHTHGVSIVGTIDSLPPHAIDIVEQDPASGEFVKKIVRKQGRDYVRTYNDAGYPNYTIKDGYPETLNVTRRLALFFTNFPDHYEIFTPKFGGEFKPTMSVAAAKGKSYVVANSLYKGAPDAMLRIGNLPRGTISGSPHSCEDSIVTAMGPGSEAVHGFLDNTKIFEIMVNALDLHEPVPAK